VAITNYYTVNGEIIGEKVGAGARIDYLTDALGSVTATRDQSGAIVNTYRYKPYGGRLAKTGTGADPSFQHVGGGGYRQTGNKYSDVYIRARHYDDATGRWSTKDPLWPHESMYGYCLSSPVRCTDRSGLLSAGTPCATSHVCGSGPCQYCRDGHGCPKPPAPGKGGPIGCVVCCNGKPYPCSFYPDPPDGKEPESGINECIIGHETQHLPDVICKDIMYAPCVYASDADRSECFAYNTQILCLGRNLERCKSQGANRAACEREYYLALCSACLNSEDFCGKVGGAWPKPLCEKYYAKCREYLN
jgi:RHS repeat-associated protein